MSVASAERAHAEAESIELQCTEVNTHKKANTLHVINLQFHRLIHWSSTIHRTLVHSSVLISQVIHCNFKQ